MDADARMKIMGDVVASACVGFALERENWPAFRAWLATTHARHLDSNPLASFLVDLRYTEMEILAHMAQRQQQARSLEAIDGVQ